MVQDTGRQMSSSALGPALPEEQQKGRHEDSFPVKQGSVRSKNTEREAHSCWLELSLRGALCRTSCCVTMSETLNDVEQAPEISKAMDLLIDIRQYKKTPPYINLSCCS